MTRLEAPSRPTILVVEDEEPVQQLVADLLDGEGYHVVVADDGAQALALAHADRPDLVLTDLMMPVMDGVELCRRLRADERTRQVPIVIMTAAGRNQSEAARADAYLPKPFDIDVLLDLVVAYVGPVH
ncbi:MAG TPA: response regulator [Chloroflexota bacterium]|nr:response regulator [Chloroflexota bacterium]